MNGLLNIAECMSAYVSSVENKSKQSSFRILGKGILAGIMIALGAAGSNVAAHSVSNVGISRLLAGIVFPVGLMMVILLGAELFTGDSMMILGVADRKVKGLSVLRMLILVYIGNLLGSVVIAVLVYFSGQFDYSSGLLGAYTIKVAAGKTGITFLKGITSGILCNILVCAAVLIAMCSKDETGKLMSSFFVILAFVTSGYEHCVANMYYIPAGLLCKMNPDYVDIAVSQYGISAEQLSGLNLQNFFVTNLVPVTIGNIIGGAVLLGLALYYLNKLKETN